MTALLRVLRAPGRLWSWMWSRAPRQLSITREGKVLIGIALAVGFAAINTGNNLLFLGWGMVLTAIIVSGLLSEQTLRVLRVQCRAPDEARAGETAAFSISLHNTAPRAVAFGVALDLQLACDGEPTREVPGPFALRLGPGERQALFTRYVPTRRGRHVLVHARAGTAYPFGFFAKSRRFQPAREVAFWVSPARVDVSDLQLELLMALGEESARRPGSGMELFALRPYRYGDDPRRIQWRRSAKADRWVVVENEALAARQVQLCLDLRGVDHASAEHALAVLGSLAEDLLARGFGVGVDAPGLCLPAASGARQRWEILQALAQVDVTAGLRQSAPVRGLSRVALVPSGGKAPEDAQVVLPVQMTVMPAATGAAA